MSETWPVAIDAPTRALLAEPIGAEGEKDRAPTRYWTRAQRDLEAGVTVAAAVADGRSPLVGVIHEAGRWVFLGPQDRDVKSGDALDSPVQWTGEQALEKWPFLEEVIHEPAGAAFQVQEETLRHRPGPLALESNDWTSLYRSLRAVLRTLCGHDPVKLDLAGGKVRLEAILGLVAVQVSVSDRSPVRTALLDAQYEGQDGSVEYQAEEDEVDTVAGELVWVLRFGLGLDVGSIDMQVCV